MKFILILLLLSALAYANETVDKAEQAFLKKEAEYKQEYDKKVLKLTLIYLKRLEEIQKNIVRSGDLEGALKVKAKIDAIKKGMNVTVKPDKDQLSAPGVDIVVGKWNWSSKTVVTFTSDKKWSFPHGKNTVKGKWSKDKKQYTMHFPNGGKDNFTINGKTLSGTSGTGIKFSATKIK